MPKVVPSSTISAVDWNARLGATLAAAAMRAGLIDAYAIVTHPVLGSGHPRISRS